MITQLRVAPISLEGPVYALRESAFVGARKKVQAFQAAAWSQGWTVILEGDNFQIRVKSCPSERLRFLDQGGGQGGIALVLHKRLATLRTSRPRSLFLNETQTETIARQQTQNQLWHRFLLFPTPRQLGGSQRRQSVLWNEALGDAEQR